MTTQCSRAHRKKIGQNCVPRLVKTDVRSWRQRVPSMNLILTHRRSVCKGAIEGDRFTTQTKKAMKCIFVRFLSRTRANSASVDQRTEGYDYKTRSRSQWSRVEKNRNTQLTQFCNHAHFKLIMKATIQILKWIDVSVLLQHFYPTHAVSKIVPSISSKYLQAFCILLG